MATTVKNPRKKAQFKQEENHESFGDRTSVDEKLKILEALGQPELVDIFRDWKPRQDRRRKAAPLDQRVAITVGATERISLSSELKSISKAGERITISQFIRNRATASVDINGWADRARQELQELEEISTKEKELRQRRTVLVGLIEEADNAEDEGLYERELSDIGVKLERLVARVEKRGQRLTGRMSMAEAEMVRWRAARLCLSTSDYLRFMIFSLEPASAADKHMSLNARRRFYVSIIEVAKNGWGDPPSVGQCDNCSTYLGEIERLRDRVRQLEAFV